ncbi:MAG: hypothetical protein V6Z86_10140 [Hyphomicrobiales bacterium]
MSEGFEAALVIFGGTFVAVGLTYLFCELGVFETIEAKRWERDRMWEKELKTCSPERLKEILEERARNEERGRRVRNKLHEEHLAWARGDDESIIKDK